MHRSFYFVLLSAAQWFYLGTIDDSFAQTSCRIMDPTGTPLNVRTARNGHVAGTLSNGTLVSVLDHASDRGGKPWV